MVLHSWKNQDSSSCSPSLFFSFLPSLALHLLVGRPPWCSGPCLQGFCGLLLLSAGPLSPWRTWSWRSLGLGDCWLWGTVVGYRAECPLYLHVGVPYLRCYPHVYSLSLHEQSFVSPEPLCVQMSWFWGLSPLWADSPPFLLSCLDPLPPWGKSLPGPPGLPWRGV